MAQAQAPQIYPLLSGGEKLYFLFDNDLNIHTLVVVRNKKYIAVNIEGIGDTKLDSNKNIYLVDAKVMTLIDNAFHNEDNNQSLTSLKDFDSIDAAIAQIKTRLLPIAKPQNYVNQTGNNKFFDSEYNMKDVVFGPKKTKIESLLTNKGGSAPKRTNSLVQETNKELFDKIIQFSKFIRNVFYGNPAILKLNSLTLENFKALYELPGQNAEQLTSCLTKFLDFASIDIQDIVNLVQDQIKDPEGNPIQPNQKTETFRTASKIIIGRLNSSKKSNSISENSVNNFITFIQEKNGTKTDPKSKYIHTLSFMRVFYSIHTYSDMKYLFSQNPALKQILINFMAIKINEYHALEDCFYRSDTKEPTLKPWFPRINEYIQQQNENNVMTFLKLTNKNQKKPYNKQRYNIGYNKDITNMLRIEYNYTNKNISKISLEEQSNTETYVVGGFTNIFFPKLSNREIAKQLGKIIEKAISGNPVFIIGYGVSGAGKTSALIYLNNESVTDKNGIVLHLCDALGARGYKRLEVTVTEFFHVCDTNSDVPACKPRPTIEFEFQNGAYNLISNIEPSKMHEYRHTDGVPSLNNLGEWLVYLIDTDRLVKSTSNNPMSSRSHSMAELKLTGNGIKPAYLYIGDFAGVENEFNCENPAVLKKFMEIEKSFYKQEYKKWQESQSQNAVLDPIYGGAPNSQLFFPTDSNDILRANVNIPPDFLNMPFPVKSEEEYMAEYEEINQGINRGDIETAKRKIEMANQLIPEFDNYKMRAKLPFNILFESDFVSDKGEFVQKIKNIQNREEGAYYQSETFEKIFGIKMTEANQERMKYLSQIWDFIYEDLPVPTNPSVTIVRLTIALTNALLRSKKIGQREMAQYRNMNKLAQRLLLPAAKYKNLFENNGKDYAMKLFEPFKCRVGTLTCNDVKDSSVRIARMFWLYAHLLFYYVFSSETFLVNALKRIKSDYTDALNSEDVVTKPQIDNINYLRYSKYVCKRRLNEGKYINSTLEKLRQDIRYVMHVKNKSVLYYSPDFVYECLEDYCFALSDCFNMRGDEKKKLFKFNCPMIDWAYTRMNSIYPSVEEFAKASVFSIFGVMNITAGENEPPPIPYIDINEIKKYSDNWNLRELFSDPYREGISLYFNEQALGIIYFGLLRTYGLIQYYKAEEILISDAYSVVFGKDEFENASINNQIVKSIIDDENYKLLEDFDSKETNMERGQESAFIQFENILNILATSNMELEKQLHIRLFNELEKIFSDFRELSNEIDSYNASSTIGTIEFIDQFSKLNTTSVLCKNDERGYTQL